MLFSPARRVKLTVLRSIWERIKTVLAHEYRFILVDETTHRQSLVIGFTVRRVLVVLSGLVGVVLLANTALIVFTPLRELIPGYPDPELKLRQSDILRRMDSLETVIVSYDSLMTSLRRVSGYTPADTAAQRRLGQTPAAAAPTLQTLAAPLLKPTVATTPAPKPLSLMWPVSGNLTSRFRPAERHFAIDIAAAEQMPVRAVAAGTVILAEYSEQTGHVIGLQHADGMLSFYKHNAQLFKRVGSWVNAGEAIAAVGRLGTHSTGAHLHLEFWLNGQPLDPLLLLPPLNATTAVAQ